MEIIQHLYHGRFDSLICKQVGSIAKKLFAFEPSEISPGYRLMQDYLDEQTNYIQKELDQIYENPHFQNVVLRDASNSIKYPHFDVKPPPRIKTEPPPSPKRTPRRSIRKEKVIEPSPQKSLLDIKDIHVKIKKPL